MDDLFASPDPEIRKQGLLAAAQTSATQNILLTIEKIAAHDPDESVRAAALEALDAPNLRALRAQRLMKLSSGEQRFILQELETWQKQGLIGDDLANSLRSRYRITFKPAPPPAAQTAAQTPPAPVLSKVEGPAAVKQAESAPATPAAPAAPPRPRQSLAQTLLSEASIKTFLYLGAFFVIAAAIILAALVETLRLPILSLAALAFGGAALAIKKRLPQPSFVLFIVFSFILPINAGVFADLINLESQALAAYWIFVLLVSAAIWVFATRFYNSRFFSLTALGAFICSAWFVPAVFSPAPAAEFRLLALQAANLAGLGGVSLLVRKKNRPFAMPAFLFGQLISAVLVSVLVVLAPINLYRFYGENDITGGLMLAMSGAWLVTAFYYISGNILVPFPLFPWFAVIALTPVLYLALNEFEFSRTDWVFALGWTIWAAFLTLLSELAQRLSLLERFKDKTRAYSLPLALAGIALFLLGGLWGFSISDTWGFALFTPAAILLALAHFVRPRGWVWLAALVNGLFAYFLFFSLPFMPETGDFLLYKFSLLSMLLLLPDLLLKPGWRAKLDWFLPLRGLGILLGALTIYGILSASFNNQAQAAASSILLSGFYWLYAIRYRKAWLGYLPALLFPLGLVYGFGALDLPFGFAAVAILSALYYGFGLALERFLRLEDWSKTLRWTGLTLILFLAVAALVGDQRFEGWFITLLALAFLLESRRYPRIEIIAPALLALGFVSVLFENKVEPAFYYLAGVSALWLATEYIYKLLLPTRPLALLTRIVGGGFGALTATVFFFGAGESPAQFVVSLAFAVFVLAYALLYRQPRLGYAFSLFFGLALLSLAILWLDSAWLWALAPLAFVYFGFGLSLKNEWGTTLRFSGLGLAALTALAAPFASQTGGGWFVAALGLPWLGETLLKKRPWAEGGFYLFGLLSLGLILDQYNLLTPAYYFFGMAIFLLGFDLIFGPGVRLFSDLARILGGVAAGISILACMLDGIETGELVISLALTVFFTIYAILRRQPALGYIPAGLLPLSVLFGLNWLGWSNWLWPLIALAVGYYLVSLLFGPRFADWSQVLRFSAIGLGTLTGLSAPFEGSGALASIPVAIAASLWAVEAFRRRNVWLGFPANGLYLMSYFMLLASLEVAQPQFYSIGAALLGLLMHYLLTRAGSDKGAFITGMISQLVLLGTTYIQMVANEELGYFAALFFQALVVLVYGLVIRSRSLVGLPIFMLVLGVSTIVLFILRGLSTVILIGCTGIVMIIVATLAVVLRERLAQVGERLSNWKA